MAFVVGSIIDVKGRVQVQSEGEIEARLANQINELSFRDTLFIPSASSVSIKLVNGQQVDLIGQTILSLDETVLPYHHLEGLSVQDTIFFEDLLQSFLKDGVDFTLSRIQTLTTEQSTILERLLNGFNAIQEQLSEQSSSAQQASDSFFSSSNQQGSLYERLALEGQVEAGFKTGTDLENFERSFEYTGDISRDSVVLIPELTLTGDQSVIEGSQASYTLALDIPPAFSFSVTINITLISAQTGDVDTSSQTIEFFPGQLSATFTLDSFDDYVADNGERFQVEVVSSSGGGYSKQPEIPEFITTQVLDDAQPNTPYDNTDTIENDSADTILLTLYALDESGERTQSNQVIEGQAASYIVIATDKMGNELDLNGSIQVNLYDVSAYGTDTQTSIDGSQDYMSSTQTVSIGQSFNVVSLDDYLADSGEQFQIALQDQSYSLANQYESISIDTRPVLTTISDDSITETPNDPSDAIEDVANVVTLQLVTTDSDGNEIAISGVAEGETAYYKVVLLDQNAQTILDATGEVSILFTDDSAVRTGIAEQAELDYSAYNAMVELNTVFSAEVLDDFLADHAEQFSVSIEDNSYTHASLFETVEHNVTPLITTIFDDAQPNTPYEDTDQLEEGTLDTVTLTLYALDESDNRVLANDVKEGSHASYIVVATDKVGNELNIDGTVQLTLWDGTAEGVSALTEIDGSQDYLNSLNSVALGTPFSIATFDDYLNEGSEQFTVALVEDSYSEASLFESIHISTSAVVTTIIDDASEADLGESVTDSIKVQLTGDLVVNEVEGELITHTLTLVDENGDTVNLPVGETIELTLAYGDVDEYGAVSEADFTSSLITSVMMTGDGGSDYTFQNSIAGDEVNEGDEGYRVSIVSVDGHSDYFENVIIDDDHNESTALIQENIVMTNDTVSITENEQLIDSTTEGNLFDNDIELGQNGKITEFDFINEDGELETAILVAGTATANTQYGTLTINENSEWSYISDKSEDHSAGDLTDLITLTVVDDNGIDGTSEFNIIVTDTAPVANDDPLRTIVEASVINGNVIDNTVDDLGDDDLAGDTVSIAEFTYENTLGAQTSYEFSEGETDKTVTVKEGTLTVYTDGAWTFLANDSVDHTAGNVSSDFSYTLKDSDGSTSSAIQFIEIIDGADPSISSSDIETDSVYENDLPNGSSPSDANLTVSGSLAVTNGTDAIETTFDSALEGATSYTSNGDAVSYELSADQLTLTAKADGATVFTVEITDPENIGLGAGYQFTLVQPLDHPDALGENSIPLVFGFDVIDSDGDAVSDSFTITLVDDIPTVTEDEAASTIDENSATDSVSGNVFSNDVLGADVVTSPVTGVAVGVIVGEVSGDVGAEITGVYGKLTLNGDGSYSYVLDNTDSDTQALVTDQAVTDVFTYTITDKDGDTATTTLTVNISGTNDAPTIDLDANDSSTATGQDYLTIFHEDESAVAITDSDIVIGEVDDIKMESAVILLTNAKADDALITDAVDSGLFTISTDTSVSGEITVVLTGSQTLADYQTAIQAITFNNSSQTPDETDRIIHVTLNDGELDSNTAISTIQVNAKPDLVDNSVEVVEGGLVIDHTTDDGNGATVEGNLLANDETGTPGGSITGFQYFDEAGDAQVGTLGVEVDTQYGALTVNADGTWQYTSDPTEDQTDTSVPDDTIPQDVVTYTYVDGNGDTADSDLVIEVLDGADPTIAPVDQSVNEVSLGYGTTLTPVTVSETLNVGQGTDSINTQFSDTQSGLEALSLASNGVALSYTITEGLITAKAGATTVFEVTLTSTTTEAAGYSFKLYQPIDHTETGITDTVWELPFDVITVDSDDNASTAGDSASGQFVVSVTDAQPYDIAQTITTNEETAITLRVSQESLSLVKITALDGIEQTVATGASTSIYDLNGVDIIGSLQNVGDGTFIFTPAAHYSNYNANPTFDYIVTDYDGDTSASTTVTIVVNPVADAPVMAAANTINVNEDADNASEGTNSVALGLTLPALSLDQTDQNGVSTGDNSERLGYITLDFNSGDGSVDGAIVEKADGTDLFTVNGLDSMTIYITPDGNANTDYHYSGLDQDGVGVIKLTETEYAGLQIIHTEDNDRNISILVTATSHEVKDDGTLLDVDVSLSATQLVTVDIQAVTEAVSLAWDDATSGTISSTTNPNDTYTSNSTSGSPLIFEGDSGRVIDLQALLSQTSGFENDGSPLGGDLDGSEERTYTVEGIPEGSLITLGTTTVAVASGQTSATIDFPDNTLADPNFTLTLPEQFGGDVNATITLSATDIDSDDQVAGLTETAIVYFNVYVDPVADIVTLQVNPANGDEDAGRTQGNTANDGSAVLVDDVANGIALDIAVTSDDKDGSETYTVVIESIPFDVDLNSGGRIFYNGVEILVTEGDKDGGSLGSGVGYIQIDDFDNSAPLVFIPPHNSDEDYQFIVSSYSVETLNGDDSLVQIQTLPLSVVVNEVADIPVNDALASVSVDDDSASSHDFNLTVVEDSGAINLKEVFAAPASLQSYDDDDSETLTLKVTNLEAAFDITGSGVVFLGGTGTDRVWFVDLAALKADQISLTQPEHFAGEITFDSIMVTTENAGDSHTHALQNISILVSPDVDASLNLSDEQIEDTPLVLDFGLNRPDTDSADEGIETLENFAINLDTVPAGVTLTGSESGVLAGSGYVTLTVTDGVLETVTATLEDHQALSGSYDFDIQYTLSDQATDDAGNLYTVNQSVTDQAYTVSVTAVTDAFDLVLDDPSEVEVVDNASFSKLLTLTGVDQDGSELWTRLEVSGVPQGITVVDGDYAGDSGGSYSGLWYVDIDPDKVIDSDGDNYTLTFDVDGAPDNALYSVTVTVFNEDSANGTEQSDSVSFDLNINNVDEDWTGQTTGTPITIDSFVQDIDQDDLADLSDADELENSVLREDVAFTLASVVDVATSGTGDFSVTLIGVPIGVDVQGATLSPSGFWTVSGSGGQADIVAKLNGVQLTPISHTNSDAADTLNTNLTFDIELTTYASGGEQNSALIQFDAAILPVTDAMALTVVNDGETLEDTAHTFSVQLDNSSDSGRTTIIGDQVYLQLTETYTDVQGDDGTVGVLSYDGVVINTQTITGVSGLSDGDYYVIDLDMDGNSINEDDILEFSYAPPEDRDGSVAVDVFVINQESETWTTYDTAEVTSTQTINFDVLAQKDGFVFDTSSTPSTGAEDSLVEVAVSVGNTDSSEILLSAALNNIPDGFLVYYGADVGSAVLAQNTGVSGTTTVQLEYGIDETVDVNLWNIPLDSGQLPDYIGIKAPNNWSGTLTGVQFEASDIDGTIATTPFEVEFTPVTDDIALYVSDTFGDAGDEIDLNLNAVMDDLDGSEVVTVTLEGLGVDAVFFASGVEIPFTTTGLGTEAEYASGTDIYTLTGVTVDDINNLTVTQSSLSGTVNVSVQMQELQGSANPTIVSDSFNLEIKAVTASSGDDVLYLGEGDDVINGLAGNDYLFAGAGADTLDGGSGLDILIGAGGADSLTGGADADTFKMTFEDQGTTDTITDFENGIDKLDLSEILEGSDLITDSDSLNEYLEVVQEGSDVRITIDSNGETTLDGTVYEILLENTLVADIDETDIID